MIGGFLLTKGRGLGAVTAAARTRRSAESCFGLLREPAVPPSKLDLLFIAAFCRRDQSLSCYRETR